VAHWLGPHLAGVAPGIESYSVGSELSVKFRDLATSRGVPAEVRALLGKKLSFA
jgi:hypothetical protein